MIRGRKLNLKTKHKNNPTKLLIITITLAILVVVISGSTYALWITDTKQTGVNVVDSICLDLNVVENTSINLQNAYQTSDSDALKLVPYNFTIVNNCSNSEIVNIQLDLKDTNTLANNDLRIALIEADTSKNYIQPTNLNDLTNVTETNESGYSKAKDLITVNITGNSSKSFNLYIWVKENASYDDIANKIFNAKVEIENVDNINMLATSYIKMIDENDDLAYDETTDNNLRYIGADPDNYVDIENGYYDSDLYYGYSSTTNHTYPEEYTSLEACQNASSYNVDCTLIHSKGDPILWRVIGVMNNVDGGSGDGETRIKIIRAESIGKYAWNYLKTNDWTTATLQTYLNGDYYDSLNSIASSLVESATYYLGGANKQNQGDYYYETMTSSDWYSAERSSNVYSGNQTSWTGIVGLMYPSDYGYATSGGSACAETTLLNWSSYSDCYSNDWLFDNERWQWTITPFASGSDRAALVDYYGYVNSYNLVYNIDTRVSPVLYLKSSVKIVGGSGTKTDPYQLSL